MNTRVLRYVIRAMTNALISVAGLAALTATAQLPEIVIGQSERWLGRLPTREIV